MRSLRSEILLGLGTRHDAGRRRKRSPLRAHERRNSALLGRDAFGVLGPLLDAGAGSAVHTIAGLSDATQLSASGATTDDAGHPSAVKIVF